MKIIKILLGIILILLCSTAFAQNIPCNNWLKIPNVNVNDYVSIGDLDVTGNQMTVEGLFNADSNYLFPGAFPQNLISKHTDPGNCNYLLRPIAVEITTTNGFYELVACDIIPHKIYHIALVYDGSSLKFYRNGFLVGNMPASGNLITNDLVTRIGNYATPIRPEALKGYINEVRIWNVARTQAQIQANMFTSLSNPTTQAGLLAYYTFDNLLNKQGNPAWNGTINGAASINNTVPNCIYVADNNGFAVDAGSDTSYCTSTSIARQLQATAGATTYSWSPAPFLNNPNIANPIATISTTTKFYVTATAANGCSGTDSVTISIGNGATIQTLADTPICKNAPLQLTATAGFSAYHWSPGIYVSDSTIANPMFMGTQNQQLIVTGITTNGCTAKDTVNITIKPLPLPIIKTIEDTLICNTNSITLNTTGATAYSWWPINNLSNPNIGNPIFNGSTDATYYVKGFNADGCYNFDTLNIYVNTLTPFIPPPNKQMCEQQTVQLDGNNGTRVSYNWTPIIYLSNNQIINPIAFPPVTTPYNVIINDKACNHTESFIVTVFVLPKPQIVATKLNDIDCAQKTAHLEATGAVSYIWSPSNGISNINASNPIASIPQKYYVTGTTLNGCFNKDSVIVLDNKAISLGRFMPNAFTPNGDNINDCYRLKNWLHLETLQFSIFNRWGDRVFFTTNVNKCWDGTFKGKKADAGNYTYMIKAKTKCGLEEQKGNILLIR
jgi:gliding motility-associated-like protein